MNDRQVKCLGASLAAVGLALTLFASLAGADPRGGPPAPLRDAGLTVSAAAGAPAQPRP
ncbi:MAG: hypothetical protein QNJ67_02360 [Kiloniellales bacterium]|nr:hypothetical protein [Kiloniellales bacterium]